MTTARKAVVIGAGLGGLAIAIRLAVRGWRVQVVEQRALPGGKMNRWQQQDYTFDTGPSLITMPGVFRELFRLADTDIADYVELKRLDPVARYMYPDGLRFEYGESLPALQEEFNRLFPHDWNGFLALMALGGRLFELSQSTFFKQAPSEPPSAQSLSALRHLPLRHGWGNYHATVKHFVQHPALIQFFNRYPTYVGSSPYQTPATLLAIPYLEYAYGAYYVAGGLYQLVSALASLLEARGAELRVRTKAVRIHTTKGRAAAVELADGQQLEADVVVFNGDAACLPQLLNCAIAPRRETPRSLSAFVLLLGLKRKLDGQHHHTVYFSSDYDQEFTELFGTDGQLPRFPVEPTVYVNAPSRSDAALAPANGETLFIMANAPALGSQWDATTTQTARKRVLAKLAAGGLSISSADIAVESIWTPSRIEDQYSMPGGAIYGQASHGWRGAFIRPANRDRRIRGLYLVGGSSHPGGGTPTVLLSARIVEKLVNRYDSA